MHQEKQELMLTSTKIEKDEKPNFFIQQFYTGCLAEATYYVESGKIATVIDPLRDTDIYVDLAKQRGAEIKYVMLTHIHADFVSGHQDLSKKTGATIVYGPTAELGFKAHVAKDQEIFKLGNIEIQLLHTPGHTRESSTFLLLDQGKPYCIFTGDCLFLGEVGRPDLAVKAGSITKEDLAGWLFDSLNNVYAKLPGETIVYPGHGAGSACGKNIQQGTSDTLENQRKTNYALLIKDRNEFVKTLCSNLPTPPAYFFHDVKLNKGGCESLDDLLKTNLTPLSVAEFKEFMKKDYIVIDSRDKFNFLQGYIKGSYSDDFKGAFASWIGKMLPAEGNYIFVAEEGKEYETVVRMARVGYDKCAGYLKGGIQAWKEAGEQVNVSTAIEVKDFLEVIKKNDSNDFIMDCRDENELWKGYLENSTMYPVWKLEGKLKENPNLIDKSKNIYCLCQSGQRSLPAIAILSKYGYQDSKLFHITGGVIELKKLEDAPLKYAEQQH